MTFFDLSERIYCMKDRPTKTPLRLGGTLEEGGTSNGWDPGWQGSGNVRWAGMGS